VLIAAVVVVVDDTVDEDEVALHETWGMMVLFLLSMFVLFEELVPILVVLFEKWRSLSLKSYRYR
jgi:hypothetical protein